MRLLRAVVTEVLPQPQGQRRELEPATAGVAVVGVVVPGGCCLEVHASILPWCNGGRERALDHPRPAAARHHRVCDRDRRVGLRGGADVGPDRRARVGRHAHDPGRVPRGLQSRSAGCRRRPAHHDRPGGRDGRRRVRDRHADPGLAGHPAQPGCPVGALGPGRGVAPDGARERLVRGVRRGDVLGGRHRRRRRDALAGPGAGVVLRHPRLRRRGARVARRPATDVIRHSPTTPALRRTGAPCHGRATAAHAPAVAADRVDAATGLGVRRVSASPGDRPAPAGDRPASAGPALGLPLRAAAASSPPPLLLLLLLLLIYWFSSRIAADRAFLARDHDRGARPGWCSFRA